MDKDWFIMTPLYGKWIRRQEIQAPSQGGVTQSAEGTTISSALCVTVGSTRRTLISNCQIPQVTAAARRSSPRLEPRLRSA
jgi:hypothetical protein